jgi:hypothetical protein
MPEAQVSYDDASFLDERLRRWTDFLASFKQMLLNPSAGAITMGTFLVGDGGSIMCSQPDFR